MNVGRVTSSSRSHLSSKTASDSPYQQVINVHQPSFGLKDLSYQTKGHSFRDEISSPFGSRKVTRRQKIAIRDERPFTSPKELRQIVELRTLTNSEPLLVTKQSTMQAGLSFAINFLDVINAATASWRHDFSTNASQFSGETSHLNTSSKDPPKDNLNSTSLLNSTALSKPLIHKSQAKSNEQNPLSNIHTKKADKKSIRNKRNTSEKQGLKSDISSLDTQKDSQSALPHLLTSVSKILDKVKNYTSHIISKTNAGALRKIQHRWKCKDVKDYMENNTNHDPPVFIDRFCEETGITNDQPTSYLIKTAFLMHTLDILNCSKIILKEKYESIKYDINGFNKINAASLHLIEKRLNIHLDETLGNDIKKSILSLSFPFSLFTIKNGAGLSNIFAEESGYLNIFGLVINLCLNKSERFNPLDVGKFIKQMDLTKEGKNLSIFDLPQVKLLSTIHDIFIGHYTDYSIHNFLDRMGKFYAIKMDYITGKAVATTTATSYIQKLDKDMKGVLKEKIILNATEFLVSSSNITFGYIKENWFPSLYLATKYIEIKNASLQVQRNEFLEAYELNGCFVFWKIDKYQDAIVFFISFSNEIFFLGEDETTAISNFWNSNIFTGVSVRHAIKESKLALSEKVKLHLNAGKVIYFDKNNNSFEQYIATVSKHFVNHHSFSEAKQRYLTELNFNDRLSRLKYEFSYTLLIPVYGCYSAIVNQDTDAIEKSIICIVDSVASYPVGKSIYNLGEKIYRLLQLKINRNSFNRLPNIVAIEEPRMNPVFDSSEASIDLIAPVNPSSDFSGIPSSSITSITDNIFETDDGFVQSIKTTVHAQVLESPELIQVTPVKILQGQAENVPLSSTETLSTISSVIRDISPIQEDEGLIIRILQRSSDPVILQDIQQANYNHLVNQITGRVGDLSNSLLLQIPALLALKKYAVYKVIESVLIIAGLKLVEFSALTFYNTVYKKKHSQAFNVSKISLELIDQNKIKIEWKDKHASIFNHTVDVSSEQCSELKRQIRAIISTHSPIHHTGSTTVNTSLRQITPLSLSYPFNHTTFTPTNASVGRITPSPLNRPLESYAKDKNNYSFINNTRTLGLSIGFVKSIVTPYLNLSPIAFIQLIVYRFGFDYKEFMVSSVSVMQGEVKVVVNFNAAFTQKLSLQFDDKPCKACTTIGSNNILITELIRYFNASQVEKKKELTEINSFIEQKERENNFDNVNKENLNSFLERVSAKHHFPEIYPEAIVKLFSINKDDKKNLKIFDLNLKEALCNASRIGIIGYPYNWPADANNELDVLRFKCLGFSVRGKNLSLWYL